MFQQRDPRCIQYIDFDKECITKAIKQLNTYAARSYDDIPAKILKYDISNPLVLG